MERVFLRRQDNRSRSWLGGHGRQTWIPSAWNAETDRLHDEFLAEHRSISEPVQELLAHAQKSPKLRGIARDELNKLGETQPYVLHELRKDDGGIKVLV